MSTTFGIHIKVINEIVPIAHRFATGNGSCITIKNPLIYLLDKDTPVIAMDNSQQGIETIGDIFNHSNVTRE